MKAFRMSAMLLGVALIGGGTSLAGAVTLDLSEPDPLVPATVTGVINGATYTWFDPSSTGTGVLNSFVQVGDASPNTGTQVSGYNTTVNMTLDNGSSDQFNRAITVGDIGFVNTGSQTVMRFVLDINQTGANPLLDLTDVQIFISTSPNQSVETFSSGVIDLTGSLLYRMDFGADSTVTLDFSENSGSGSGDMLLDIPISLFDNFFADNMITDASAKNAYNIYLFSAFGQTPNFNNDGFEEWGYFAGNPYGETPCVPGVDPECTPSEVAEPGMLSLLGLGLLGVAACTRRRLDA